MNYKKRNIGYNISLKLNSAIEGKEKGELKDFIKDKNNLIQNIIRNTIMSIKHKNLYEIFSNNDVALSINMLNDLYEKTNEFLTIITGKKNDIDNTIDLLQKIIDKLSLIICGFGTQYIDDLLFISFGSQFVNIKIDNEIVNDKYELIRKYIHPIGYKIIYWKNNITNNSSIFSLCSNKSSDEIMLIENSNMFECFDVESNIKSFYQKIYGIRIVIQNEKQRKSLIINGIIDEIQLNCFTNKYIEKRKEELLLKTENLSSNEKELMLRIIDVLTFKDILIYSNDDIYKRIFLIMNEINIVKNNKLDITVKRFLEMDICSQRNMLVNLLTYNTDDEIQYICYLLYDLISINSSDNIDTNDQNIIYDSFPWKIKTLFKDAIKYTIKYTNDMMQKYDINRITLEQQIYLMKTDENIKEKAIVKLKEIKGKPDESVSKAKQYLEGLIKIPFGVYKEEPILKRVKEMNQQFIRIIANYNDFFNENTITNKEKYTNIEILKFIKFAKEKIFENILKQINENIENQTTKQMSYIIQYINNKKKENKEKKIQILKKNKNVQTKEIIMYLNEVYEKDNNTLVEIYDLINKTPTFSLSKTINEMNILKTNINDIHLNINKITDVLDDSIHGHNHAKNQILKIIGQWMNGEQTGYSFGFEGSPGIGKTSLAKKGLANCLKDGNGLSRPFNFIALGGSCNGSTLEGHGYTYVNSTWGRIVDILIESKCMNPIIYIDELDKVSKTENGKEIIGILTHLIDSTQNDSFQDKYFSGINIDLSKVLFIFSYNDPEQIDKILLDRIHRIKFDNLSLNEKIVIVNRYILPDINKNMGFENIIVISDKIIEHIIDNYTMEPGVRKLKELLFDLYGEINIELLKCKDSEQIKIPIVITEKLLEDKYLNKYNKVQEKTIHSTPEIGIINGLWANTLGRGGIIPIQSMFFPSTTFLEFKLTGLQGDVMKESMNVAKTLAWNITPIQVQKDWIKHFETTKCQGLHIHCPDGAVSKDGPSAGTAITIAIYSLLNKKLIRNDIAITGEINLQGEITPIGGLDLKILGGIKAGIKLFLYPEKNHKDFNEFIESYENTDFIQNIEFKEVKYINEVFQYVFI
jgi:ATP-dependent Lon protease